MCVQITNMDFLKIAFIVVWLFVCLFVCLFLAHLDENSTKAMFIVDFLPHKSVHLYLSSSVDISA